MITVFTDLAVAVLCGIVIAALNFAWQHASEIRTEVTQSSPDEKTYLPHGTLFFASVTHFLELFDPQQDPQRVLLDCRHLHLVDHSAVAALENLYERYTRAGKQLQLTHLSARSRHLLQRVGMVI